MVTQKPSWDLTCLGFLEHYACCHQPPQAEGWGAASKECFVGGDWLSQVCLCSGLQPTGTTWPRWVHRWGRCGVWCGFIPKGVGGRQRAGLGSEWAVTVLGRLLPPGPEVQDGWMSHFSCPVPNHWQDVSLKDFELAS